MSYLLSIDPGLRKCGAALWHDSELVEARLLVGEHEGREVDVTVAVMVDAAIAWCIDVYDVASIGSLKPWLHLAVEYPRTYGGRSSRGDANDLIGVALVAGAILGRLGCPAQLLLPEEWKGRIHKPESKAEYERDGYVVEARARAKLSAAELERVEWGKDWKKRMDVSDAVGIGLHVLGR